ncbi:actin interacting protein 3, partial [Sporodiniella umbellata]
QENTDSSQTQALREEIERFKSRQVSDAREIKRLRDALAQREDRAMEREQEGWEETMAHVSHRLECLQDNVDQLKTDITQRRCRPSKDRLASCENEAGWLGQQLEIARKELARYRPQWKKQWESELQQIVKEQQRLKAQELHLSDLSEDYRAIGDVLDQAGQISRLHQRKKEKGGEYMRPPAEAGFDGMASVLQQVAMIKVDHAQRLQALEKAQQARAKTLSQRMDAFERELVDFVLLRKLKNTGGPQQIDQQRQITDKTFIQHIFANKQV